MSQPWSDATGNSNPWGPGRHRTPNQAPGQQPRTQSSSRQQNQQLAFHAEIRALIDQAYEKGYEKGYKEGQGPAYGAGFAAGHRSGYKLWKMLLRYRDDKDRAQARHRAETEARLKQLSLASDEDDPNISSGLGGQATVFTAGAQQRQHAARATKP
ncbi:hypothetical protein E0Z10_g9559 [Xylaria hypoxylon]|uniref:Uncharacterized protein n=1 Tax=Xylaria hypoxylon TaxID=37992 RepID=A0A4Z0YIS8_9PEZI|nr:hypothetical protein E0Z10_g9559 [Xylaria hypoxylon]